MEMIRKPSIEEMEDNIIKVIVIIKQEHLIISRLN